MESSRPASLARRLARAAGATIGVAASFLTFPSSIPWMILGWLILHAFWTFRERHAWIALAACLVVLLIKRVYWGPGLIVLAGVMGVSGSLGLWLRKRPWRWAAVALLAPAWLAMVLDWQASARTSRHPALDPDRPVVCMGDSLTAGGYPELLSGLLRVPVVDLAHPGIDSEGGVRRIPRMIAARPQVVLLELGGHDFLRGHPRDQARANLGRIIGEARALGAEVILFEVPRGFVMDAYRGLERELARAHDLELISDGPIRNLVLRARGGPLGFAGPCLSEDGIHPNGEGNRYLSEVVKAALVRVYGPGILR